MTADATQRPTFSLDECTAAACVALVALAVYVRTLAPTVYGEDTGELIAAAYTLGVPHPTGYPLWCILAKLFIAIVPFGDVAWRANLMSAVFGAGTVGLIVLLTARLSASLWAAAAAGLALAFSFEFWEQSVIAEVYTLNAFIAVLCVALLVCWRDSRNTRYLYGFAFALGLGLANHNILILLVPVYAVAAAAFGGRGPSTARAYLNACGFCALGLAVYLYLPIRSLADPAMDWGNPETLQGLWDVVTRKQYRFIITDGPRSLARFASQLGTFASIYLDQFTPAFGCLVPVGAAVLWRRERSLTALLIAIFAVTSIGCILVPNFDADRMSVWINTTYWIPAYAVAAPFVGAALMAIANLATNPVQRRVTALVLVIAAGAIPLRANFAHNDRSADYLASDEARNILLTMEPSAVYFGDSDHTLFPVMYLQIVEGMRPDVLIANPYGYPVETAFAAMPDAVKQSFHSIPTEAEEQIIFEWLLEQGDRPVYSTTRRSAPGATIENVGLLYRYTKSGSALASGSPWDEYQWHSLDASQAMYDDWTAELVLFDYHFARGRTLLDAGNTADGRAEFDKAAAFAYAYRDGLNNLGCTASEHGLNRVAIGYFAEALRLKPDDLLILRNLSRAYMRMNKPVEAGQILGRALAIDPGDEESAALLSQAEKMQAEGGAV